MSTYLVAYVIGAYDYVETTASINDTVRIRVYTSVGKKEQGLFALEVSLFSLMNLKFEIIFLDSC